MFCLERGLPIDPAPFDPRKTTRKRIGPIEKIKRLFRFFSVSR